MIRGLVAVTLAALAGCAPSVIGPFVKSITRTPDALAIVSCEIVLSGGDLSEGRCYSQVVPLDRAPAPPSRSPQAAAATAPTSAGPPAR